MSVANTHTIQTNQESYSIQINVIDDNLYEGEQEKAVFRLQVNPTLARIGEDDTFTLTITDDDRKPTLRASLHQAGTEGGQNQGTEPVQGQDFANVVFKLEMQGQYGLELPVNIEAIDGTAVAGEDYNLTTNSVTFTGQKAVHYVKVPVIDNNVFGGSKNFQLKISSGDSHFIPHPPIFVTGVIKDNDEPAEGR